MTRPFIFARGRVKSAAIVTPANGKPYLAVKVEMPPEEINGYRSIFRFEARVRWRFDSLDLQPGDWIAVHGEAKAEAYRRGDEKLDAIQIIDAATIIHDAKAATFPSAESAALEEQAPAASAAIPPPVEKPEAPPASLELPL